MKPNYMAKREKYQHLIEMMESTHTAREQQLISQALIEYIEIYVPNFILDTCIKELDRIKNKKLVIPIGLDIKSYSLGCLNTVCDVCTEVTPQKENNWEGVAAKTALEAYKNIKHYAKFSEIIYQGFTKAISEERASKRCCHHRDAGETCIQRNQESYELGSQDERERIVKELEEVISKYNPWPEQVYGGDEFFEGIIDLKDSLIINKQE